MIRTRKPLIAWLTLIAIAALPFSVVAQTQIKYHSNKFSIQDDVKLGRQAAQEAEQQFPLLRDEATQDYVERVGSRLVAAIPSQFQHPEFQYFFKVVNARDINAFALPGGPMYVNRGMIEAARTEGEMAGVMAHEISHVALRHGTAQATKGQKLGTLATIAGIGATILTRNPNVGQLAQAPFAVYLLKFSREYETEADILGSQIMARLVMTRAISRTCFKPSNGRVVVPLEGSLVVTPARRIVMRGSIGKLRCCESTIPVATRASLHAFGNG